MNDYKTKMKHYPHRTYFITLHPHRDRLDDIENEEQANDFIQEWFRRKAVIKRIENAQPPTLFTETEHDTKDRPHTHSILITPKWLNRYGITSSDFLQSFSDYADSYEGSAKIQELPTKYDFYRAVKYTQKEKQYGQL